jgi:tRNA(Ile)-lysidine synthase TilS/MesJ
MVERKAIRLRRRGERVRTHMKIRICERCVLPETFPGITFDSDGVCNYCRREESALAKSSEKKGKYRERLDMLIQDVKRKAPVYDAIVAYSGGKDSSYTLKLLKDRYDLRLLAFSLDNQFVSPVAWKNIGEVTDALGVDYIRFRPSWPILKKLFCLTSTEDIFPAPTLLRASAVCTACIGIVKSLVLKTSLEMSIPLVVFGWSPGQAPIQSAIMKTNPALIRQNQTALKKAFPSEVRQGMSQYFISDSYYEIYKDRFPYNVHPLAFFDYDEEAIKHQLDDLGWQAPADTDTNSTNCLLNAFANECHLKRHGYHPYVWEIANMARQGVMSREEGIQKIYAEQNQEMVKYARERLGL